MRINLARLIADVGRITVAPRHPAAPARTCAPYPGSAGPVQEAMWSSRRLRGVGAPAPSVPGPRLAPEALRHTLRSALAARQAARLRQLLDEQGLVPFTAVLAGCSPRVVADVLSLLDEARRRAVSRHLPLRLREALTRPKVDAGCNAEVHA